MGKKLNRKFTFNQSIEVQEEQSQLNSKRQTVNLSLIPNEMIIQARADFDKFVKNSARSSAKSKQIQVDQTDKSSSDDSSSC